ncbi:flagellar basal body-associated protein FliL [Falsiruegeria litorea R37]|uniref:Flagellar protein FliL n=1 Tax=Falsiruegeria litorea R37 TaxID=1200284 RepID=A0A1Y5TGX2_9RHOB|nr:flagellar basal body-associated FliL family protein [Falsiruegeria litorea]SLN63626.1 flagellar basal body-associated protein FliL [Falsiruegeria litorea R37]
MSDVTADELEPEKKGGKLPLIIGLVLGLVGAGAGFYATTSGLIPIGSKSEEHAEKAQADDTGEHPAALPDIEYVDLTPIMITLSGGETIHQLRFHAQLEVESKYHADVEKIRPRVLDVLNGYLRALELSDLRDPLALTRLRGQMLRRIGIVAGKGRVRDLLVIEFVLN